MTMRVRQLIAALLDYDMEEEIVLHTEHRTLSLEGISRAYSFGQRVVRLDMSQPVVAERDIPQEEAA